MDATILISLRLADWGGQASTFYKQGKGAGSRDIFLCA